ncbi:uncharacterized protein LOC129600806 [Paramacrobiotus metropolitanus]|uniref:uncharacterized protein LOC129600806 n=1 Tax=Paramacrobiotus metropolitanus TaxID=2943436 RepID=UPI0024460E11|nr:uncharacterized protein LOC129600806 [Paramacrobiotus metropolitanus]
MKVMGDLVPYLSFLLVVLLLPTGNAQPDALDDPTGNAPWYLGKRSGKDPSLPNSVFSPAYQFGRWGTGNLYLPPKGRRMYYGPIPNLNDPLLPGKRLMYYKGLTE